MRRLGVAWKEAGKIFSLRWRALVGFQVCYGLGVTLVFTPLVHLCLNAMVRSGGDSAITNFDLSSFFLSLTGMGFLAVAGLTGMISLRLQQASLYLLTASADVSPLSALKGAFQRLKSLLALTFIQLSVLLALALPLLVVILLVWHFLLGHQDINYYTHAKPASWYWALGLTGTVGLATVAVGVWVMARWVYTLPILLRSGESAWKSLQTSVQYTKGNWVPPLIIVGGFWVLLWGASNGVNGSVFGLGRWVLLVSGERLALSVFVVLVVFGTWGLVSLATGMVGPIIHAILINRIFDTTFSMSPNHFPQESAKNRRLIRRIILAVVLGALIAFSFGGAWWLKRLDFSDPDRSRPIGAVQPPRKYAECPAPGHEGRSRFRRDRCADHQGRRSGGISRPGFDAHGTRSASVGLSHISGTSKDRRGDSVWRGVPGRTGPQLAGSP
ncbi:MAG: glycerophosphoryl diester phosphodiesterase membrane domain-containing protein [Elusimicrobia bacterium]|nr:glycerophosphoryl diester phosphodiesterase membrane domain-containing protein [Elusimicrobiota bacterium]